MAKFFRGFRLKFLEDGSLRRYLAYALGEILLVTIGILFALQVNNWNQDRLRSREEQELLGAISVEMENNRFRNEQGKRRQDEIISAAERLLTAAHHPEERPSEEQLDQDIQKLLIRWFATKSSSTYDAVIGAGKLGLLSSVELRNELAALKWQMELLGLYESIQARFVDEQLTPYLNRSMNRLPGVAEQLEISELLQYHQFSTGYDDLLGDREFSNLLVDLIRHTQPVIRSYIMIDNVISRIESHVGVSTELDQ